MPIKILLKPIDFVSFILRSCDFVNKILIKLKYNITCTHVIKCVIIKIYLSTIEEKIYDKNDPALK